MTTKELRRERADKLAEYMRAHAKNFHMRSIVHVDREAIHEPPVYTVQYVKPRIEKWCGTSCCIAGFAVCLFGESNDQIDMAYAANLLGLNGMGSYGISRHLFVPDSCSADFGFAKEHRLDNTDVEVAIEALYHAVKLQEELEHWRSNNVSRWNLPLAFARR
jgi:hypothetical protein